MREKASGRAGGRAHCTDHSAVRVVVTTGAGVATLVKVGRATENNERRDRSGERDLHSAGEGAV